ncbi:hypothetical protein NE237_022490 [Protea cynaroides]|uniref:Uncharacterized protein n=1 Tax=Protea cynaroides TaxID=273540 RepID=A0A9Q0K491_9MAGN|nr:hypothetical protein NE237_022490 [Protea cynaroides]
MEGGFLNAKTVLVRTVVMRTSILSLDKDPGRVLVDFKTYPVFHQTLYRGTGSRVLTGRGSVCNGPQEGFVDRVTTISTFVGEQARVPIQNVDLEHSGSGGLPMEPSALEVSVISGGEDPVATFFGLQYGALGLESLDAYRRDFLDVAHGWAPVWGARDSGDLPWVQGAGPTRVVTPGGGGRGKVDTTVVFSLVAYVWGRKRRMVAPFAQGTSSENNVGDRGEPSVGYALVSWRMIEHFSH